MERIGRYQILAELGRGAMGIVYRARDPKIGRDVAIKTIHLANKADPSETVSLKDRLFREAQSAGRLSHPGIVTIYDIEEENGVAFITMEFVEGRTLENLMVAGEARDPQFVVDVLRQTAAALDYAHSREIIHRDVKPANVMVTPEGRVKITDFGIARITSSKLTQTGTVMGTPNYMSPEQVRGDATIDGRSDLFSLGVIVYELVAGQRPFHADSLTAVIFKIVSEQPASPRLYNPGVSPEMEAAIMKALAKDPADRYAKCMGFAEALAGLDWQGLPELPVVDAKSEHDLATSGVDLGETAPSVRIPPQPAETGSHEQTPSLSPPVPEPSRAGSGLPPLAARGGKPALTPEAKAAPLPPSARAGRPSRSPLAAGQEKRPVWPWVAGALAILAVVAAFLAQQNPWMLEDPIGALRTVLPASSDRTVVEESVDAVLSQDRVPLPPPELSEQIEQRAGSTAEEAAPPSAGSLEAAPSPDTAVESPAPVEKPAPPTPRSTTVRIATSAPGAQVVIDRQPKWSCTTPCSLELPRGKHVAMASLAGYRGFPKVFEVGSDAIDLSLDLDALLGTLLISSQPEGASIQIDGKPVQGVTNLKQTVTPGYHLIRVQKQDGGVAERNVYVREDDLLPIHFVFGSQQAPQGRLALSSQPAGASVVLNDRRRVGPTPQQLDLAPGDYRVAFSLQGYRPVIREIELTAGQTLPVDVTLSRFE